MATIRKESEPKKSNISPTIVVSRQIGYLCYTRLAVLSSFWQNRQDFPFAYPFIIIS